MKAIVVFDGVCNLCNGAVRFILKHDKKGVFQYSWMQSETGRRLVAQYPMDAAMENSIVLILDEQVYTRSAAVLKVLNMIGGGWKIFYLLIWIPGFIRDGIYDFIARNRYRWFGRKKECEPPAEKYRSRFLL